MKPDPRSAQRFLEGLAEACPIADLDHLYLVHWPAVLPSPLDILQPMGFRGTLVAGRQSVFQRFQEHNPTAEVVLDDHPTHGQATAGLLMELTPGKDVTRWTIQRAMNQLKPGGKLWIFGSREEGIASLDTLFPQATTVYYRGHLRLVALTAGEAALPAADENFRWVAANQVKLASLPGLFSWDRPDPASLLLLKSFTKSPGALVLDFGCGNGILGITLAKLWPETRVVMSDDLYAAVRCTQQSITTNELADRCQVVAENGVGAKLARFQFNTILSNPPFHRGTRSDYQVARQFIAAAAAILAPGGEIRVVGSRFLDYGQVMSATLKEVAILAQENNFVVWRAIRPARG